MTGGNGTDVFVFAVNSDLVLTDPAVGAAVDTIDGGAGDDTIQIAGAITIEANTCGRV